MASRSAAPERLWRTSRFCWLVGGAAVLALIYFDLGPPLAFNDDWGMAWSARQFMLAHHVHIFPQQSALALVQTVWSTLVTLGHPDQRLLRLSIVPFVLLAAFASSRLARTLGAGPLWTPVAAVLLLATPLYLTGATTYMSDTAYLGLLMMVALTGAAWVEKGEGRLACVLWATLCPLQRQVGIVIPAAVTVALLLARRERRLERKDGLFLAALWIGVAGAAALPVLAGWAPPTQANRLAGIANLQPARQLWPLLYLPSMLGLLLIPLAAALAFQRRAPRRPNRTAALLCLAIATLGFADAVYWLVHHDMIYPGDVWTRVGFTPTVLGEKVAVFPPLLFAAMELLTVIAFTVLLIGRRDSWSFAALGRRGVFLVMLSGAHFLPLLVLQTQIFDRYYLPVIAPLIPLLAALAAKTTRPRLAASWALVALAAGLALYLVGQQDYEAWQVARDQAARLAYQMAAPDEVNAGYEANAVYVELPQYERTGRLSGSLSSSRADYSFPVVGPAHPRITLRFAPPSDPRPGVDYRSLRPGRIVLQEGDK